VSIGTGTKLGQYEVQDFIGQGAMGLVYRAYHAQLARTGAVKVMQAIAPDSDSIARFRREAQAIAQMRHPNILNVFDFGEHEGMPYMIVEYVPGGSLANRLSQGNVDQTAALKYLRGIAAGLDHAHGLGIIHRDVKPANVLLERDDTPVLADFGLAKLLQSSSVKSMTGVTTGTPAYMSPEQVTGGQVGPPADRYSLATIAYEMLTGSIPFDGEGLMEVLYAQVHREPPLPSARNSSLSPQVDAVIMRGLAKDPAARWESCTAFVDALAAALAAKAEPAMARTVVMAPPVASTMPLAPLAAGVAVATQPRADSANPNATVAMPYPASAQPVAKKKSRKRLVAAVIAGILVVLLILGVLLNAASKPTLSLSASTVTAGDTVVVNASHLPANQNGEIELLSTLHTFPFHAGPNGNVSVPITVPRNIGAGDHMVKICWGSSCRASATLHVIEPVASVTPSSGTTPTPSALASPTSRPTASPTAPQTPPSSPPARSLALSSGHIKILTGTMTVKGFNFSPGKTATLTFIQGTVTNKNVSAGVVGADGTFLQTYTIPATAIVGSAYIRACDVSACVYASISVTAT
jgi:Protein kinase domain